MIAHVSMLLRVTGSILLLLLILTAPALTVQSAEGVYINPAAPVQQLQRLIEDLQSGEFFSYTAGKMERDIRRTLPRYFSISLFYVSLSLAFSLLAGLLTGIITARNSSRGTAEILSFFSALPDFIIVLILQLISITMFQHFGVRLGRIAYFSMNSYFMILPFTTMIITSVTFMVRSVSNHTRTILSQDYILFAKSKGLSKNIIYRRHIIPGLCSQLHGEIHKFISIGIGTLFIVERLFNIPGITRMLFSYGFTYIFDMDVKEGFFQPNFNVALVSIFSLSIIYALCYLLFSAVLRIIRKAGTHT